MCQASMRTKVQVLQTHPGQAWDRIQQQHTSGRDTEVPEEAFKLEQPKGWWGEGGVGIFVHQKIQYPYIREG